MTCDSRLQISGGAFHVGRIVSCDVAHTASAEMHRAILIASELNRALHPPDEPRYRPVEVEITWPNLGPFK